MIEVFKLQRPATSKREEKQTTYASAVLQLLKAMDPAENTLYSLDEMDLLLAAAQEGDVLKIEGLIRPELDIDTRGRDETLPNKHGGRTMLEKAAAHNQLEMMKFLILQGANLNLAWDEETLLTSAAFRGNADVVKLAIESGADINRRRFMGLSALHEAVEGICAENLHSKIAVVKVLVDYGLDIDSTDENGETALHMVAMSGNLQMAEVLVSQGANVNAHVKYAYTPLDRAANGGSLEVARFLLERGADVDADAAGCLGLGLAATSGDTPMVLLLLDHGAKADTTPGIKHSELTEAAKSGNAETIDLLYRRGFACQGPGALFAATLQMPLRVVELLLAQGVDINARGRNGRSLLHAAVLRESYRARTPSYIKGPQWEVLQFLLNKGADLSIQDSNGQTAQDLAVASNHIDAVEMFETKSRCP